MTVSLDGFDATKVDPSAPMEVLPAGKYVAHITGAEKKESQNKPGNHYLSFEFTVLDGPHKGRKLWALLNLWNQNSTASEIAQRDLSAICHAVGVLNPRSTDELRNKPLFLTVGTEKRADNGELQNRIKGYESTEAVAAAAASAPTAGGDERPAWMKKS